MLLGNSKICIRYGFCLKLFYHGTLKNDWIYSFLAVLGPLNAIYFTIFAIFYVALHYKAGEMINDAVVKAQSNEASRKRVKSKRFLGFLKRSLKSSVR
jgi:hypothetical protein